MVKDGLPIPKALLNKPSVDEYLLWVEDAFDDLSTERTYLAMGGCTRIPWGSIDRYAQRYGIIDSEDFDRFKYLISALDQEFLKDVAERMKRATAEGEKSGH